MSSHLLQYINLFYSQSDLKKIRGDEFCSFYLFKGLDGVIYVVCKVKGKPKILGYTTLTEFFGHIVDIEKFNNLDDITQKHIKENTQLNSTDFKKLVPFFNTAETNSSTDYLKYKNFINSYPTSKSNIFVFKENASYLLYLFIDCKREIYVVCISKVNSEILGYTTPEGYYRNEKYCLKVRVLLKTVNDYVNINSFYSFVTKEKELDIISFNQLNRDNAPVSTSNRKTYYTYYENFKDSEADFFYFRENNNRLYFFFRYLNRDIYVISKLKGKDEIVAYTTIKEYFEYL